MEKGSPFETDSQCFYCDTLLSAGQLETDHFPIPEACGGIATVRCCVACHDMKDRFAVTSWPAEWIEQILGDFPRMRRPTRIFLARCMAAFATNVNNKKGEAP